MAPSRPCDTSAIGPPESLLTVDEHCPHPWLKRHVEGGGTGWRNVRIKADMEDGCSSSDMVDSGMASKDRVNCMANYHRWRDAIKDTG